jgi:hypothetical protein
MFGRGQLTIVQNQVGSTAFARFVLGVGAISGTIAQNQVGSTAFIGILL